MANSLLAPLWLYVKLRQGLKIESAILNMGQTRTSPKQQRVSWQYYLLTIIYGSLLMVNMLTAQPAKIIRPASQWTLWCSTPSIQQARRNILRGMNSCNRLISSHKGMVFAGQNKKKAFNKSIIPISKTIQQFTLGSRSVSYSSNSLFLFLFYLMR